MKRKLFLGLGTIASIAAPIAAVVSCGDEIANGKMSWNRGDKELTFNLFASSPKGAFESYLNFHGDDHVLNGEGFLAAAKDFATATTQNNVLKLKEGDKIKVVTFIETFTKYDFKALDNLRTTTTDKAKKAAIEKTLGDKLEDWTVGTKHRVEFFVEYHAKGSDDYVNLTKGDFAQKNNFLEALLKAFQEITTIAIVKDATNEKALIPVKQPAHGTGTSATPAVLYSKDDFTQTVNAFNTKGDDFADPVAGNTIAEAIKKFMTKTETVRTFK